MPSGESMKEKQKSKRLELCKSNNHVPDVRVEKLSFDKIDKMFSNDELSSNKFFMCSRYSQIRVRLLKHIPQIENSTVMNCANSETSNAGYSIDHKITQEGQLFFDTDLFSGNLEEHYPFNFDKELLIAENVCFHNSVDVQFDRDSKRHNKVIFVASKPLNNPKETFYLVPELTRIIEAFFKICIVQRDKHIVLWPLGCGVFKNDPTVVSKIFVSTIKKYFIHFNTIEMIIYDRWGKDKDFFENFVMELRKHKLNYRIN